MKMLVKGGAAVDSESGTGIFAIINPVTTFNSLLTYFQPLTNYNPVPTCSCIGLEDTHHVLEEKKGVIYNAVLGMVDIMRGTNSYYKLQVLEEDKRKSYELFRSWGRVGTTIGGCKLEVQQ